MQLKIDEATGLAIRVLTRHGMRERYARMTADHLVDSALCGHEFSSLPRVLAIVDELNKKPPAGDVRILREDDRTALIDGADNIGYVVSLIGMEKAIELCAKSGVGVVCARNSWFSGRLAYYVERAAQHGYIGLHTTNTTARVAPYGGIDRLFGTNPFAIAFPADEEPLVIDIGTSKIAWGETLLARNKSELLPENVAVDAAGNPTRDPDAALDGAFLPWGGHRGFGVALAVQLLGVLAGSEPVVGDDGTYGLFFLACDPGLFMPREQFSARVAELRRIIKRSRPAQGASEVRVPGEASLRRRRENTVRGVINLDDRIYERILALAS